MSSLWSFFFTSTRFLHWRDMVYIISFVGHSFLLLSRKNNFLLSFLWMILLWVGIEKFVILDENVRPCVYFIPLYYYFCTFTQYDQQNLISTRICRPYCLNSFFYWHFYPFVVTCLISTFSLSIPFSCLCI